MSDVAQKMMRTALASYPRSGNTWLRYLIELATGERSGSVYDDRILPRGREGIVIKTHLCNRQEFDRAIHLVRDPFDAIESYFHWKRDIQGDTSVEWDKHVRSAAVEWREHTLHWLALAPPPSEVEESPRRRGGRGVGGAHNQQDRARDSVHLVRYEDLRAQPAHELQRVLTFLGYNVSEEQCQRAANQAALERMRELHPTLGDRFFRKGEIGAGRAAFDEALARYMTEALGELLTRFGYDHRP